MSWSPVALSAVLASGNLRCKFIYPLKIPQLTKYRGAPLYISEIAPPNLRGNLLVLEQFSIVVGSIIAYWLSYGTNEMSNDWCFRLPFLLQMVPAGIVGCAILTFPYSPRWLAMVGRKDECLESLCKLRRLPASDQRVQIEFKGILAEVEFQNIIQEKEHPNSRGLKLELAQWADLFKPKIWRRTAIAIGMPWFQQLSGINAMQYYAPTLYATIGIGLGTAKLLTGMINIFQLIGVTITLFYMDKFGRRPLTIWGAAMMGIPHCIMAGIVGAFSKSWPEHQAVAWLGVAVLYFYMFSYGKKAAP